MYARDIQTFHTDLEANAIGMYFSIDTSALTVHLVLRFAYAAYFMNFSLTTDVFHRIWAEFVFKSQFSGKQEKFMPFG